MTEFLYDIDSGLIALALFVSMALAIEAGYRIGRARSAVAAPAAREHINGIQQAILGVLALMLGFTFSLALQRFDTRSQAVVDEANAIGTAWLRTAALPDPLAERARTAMRAYADVRLDSAHHTMVERGVRAEIDARAQSRQAELWQVAVEALKADRASQPASLYAQAVNELIDSYGRRAAGLDRHVPEVVLLLLYATFVLAGAVVGYAAGVGSHRPSAASYLMVALIVVLVFIILDLDRPRRGLIRVSQQSFSDLQASMRTAPAVPGR